MEKTKDEFTKNITQITIANLTKLMLHILDPNPHAILIVSDLSQWVEYVSRKKWNICQR